MSTWKRSTKVTLLVALLSFTYIYTRGQTVFADSELQAIGPVMASHIERMVDSLSVMQSEEQAVRFARRKSLAIYVDGNESKTPHAAARQFLALKANKYQLYLAKNEKSLSCRWVFDGGRSVRILAAISREAVEGTDKEEADKKVFATLQTLPAASLTSPVPEEKTMIRTSKTSMFEHTGGSFWKESVNGSTYYCHKDGQLTPVFDKQFAVESIHNMMLNTLPDMGYKLELKQSIYNTQSEVISVSLKNFVAYWQQQGCYNCYCGVSREAGQKDYGVIVIVEHKELQYIHMLKFNCDDTLFDRSGAAFSATFTTNIPQHNIKSLFE